MLTTTALRGVSTASICNKTGVLNSAPIQSLALHLSIGDTWNAITNVEKRQGASALGVLVVWGMECN